MEGQDSSRSGFRRWTRLVGMTTANRVACKHADNAIKMAHFRIFTIIRFKSNHVSTFSSSKPWNLPCCFSTRYVRPEFEFISKSSGIILKRAVEGVGSGSKLAPVLIG